MFKLDSPASNVRLVSNKCADAGSALIVCVNRLFSRALLLPLLAVVFPFVLVLAVHFCVEFVCCCHLLNGPLYAEKLSSYFFNEAGSLLHYLQVDLSVDFHFV